MLSARVAREEEESRGRGIPLYNMAVGFHNKRSLLLVLATVFEVMNDTSASSVAGSVRCNNIHVYVYT